MYTEEEERDFIQADYINVQKQIQADKEYGIRYGMFLEGNGDKYLKHLTKKLGLGGKYAQFTTRILDKRLDNLEELGTNKDGTKLLDKDTGKSILAILVSLQVSITAILIFDLPISVIFVSMFLITYLINFKIINRYSLLRFDLPEIMYTIYQTLIFPVGILVKINKNIKLRLDSDFDVNTNYTLKGYEEDVYNKLRTLYVLRGFSRHKVKVIPTSEIGAEELLYKIMGTDAVSEDDINREFDKLLDGLNTPIEINTTQSIGYMTYLYKLLIVNKDLGVRLSTNNFKVNKEIEDLELKKELIEDFKLTEDSLIALILQLETDKNLIEETSYLSKSIKELEESEELRQKKLGYVRKYRNEYEISKEDAKLLLGDKQREKLVKGIKQESQTKLKEISNKLDKINSKL